MCLWRDDEQAVPPYGQDTTEEDEELTAGVSTPPRLRWVPVQVSTTSSIAPVDICRLSRQASPWHTTFIPVDLQIPAAKPSGHLRGIQKLLNET